MQKKQPFIFHQRSPAEPTAGINYRAGVAGEPATFDEESRSVEVIGATEERIQVLDRLRWEIIDEILLMTGCQMPKARQVVLLDNHQRYDTASVIGSYRDMRLAGGKLLGRVHYSTVPEAEGAYIKMREGHLTDYSVGYQVLKSVWVPAGESKTVKGREYAGPVSVVTKWKVRELSNCPIGADEKAKTRGDGPAAADNNFNNPKLKDARIQPLKENKMNAKLRKLLEARGLESTATDAEAWRFYEDLDSQVRSELINLAAVPEAVKDDPKPAADAGQRRDPLPVPGVIVELTDPVADERARAGEIRAMGRSYDCLDEIEAFITDGSTVDQARAKVLEVVAERGKTQPAPEAGFSPVRVVADERDKFRSAALDALLVRADQTPEKIAPGADELTGYSMVEMARMALRFANQPTAGSSLEMVGRALTGSDFPILLSNVANKSLFAGFESAEETWPEIFASGTVTDFKTQTSARASETDDLDEIPEEGEFKYGSQTEAKEEYSIATYGKLYSISRQAIINDDLGALTTVPRNHGEAAARKIGDVGYAVLTANAAMGDGTALFHADHSNLGTGGALAAVKLAEMIKLMKLQKDLKGKRRLNIRPRFFLAPVALEGSAEQFFTSVIDPGKAINGVNNPYAGKYFTRVYEPRLDDDSATAYYILGAQGKTVTIFFLNGKQAPYMETRQGWNVDGVEYKVRIDAGAKALDWKALVKNAGA